tara:strand:+ start:411 stop:833 length:423 start_codon:yes stop_codon:yes gene_type:complete
MSFSELAAVENPGKNELKVFVEEVRGFLRMVVEDQEKFGFLWRFDPELQQLATETLRFDILEGAGLELDEKIQDIDDQRLVHHGLLGLPLHFKFRVISAIEGSFETAFAGGSMPPIPKGGPLYLGTGAVGSPCVIGLRRW